MAQVSVTLVRADTNQEFDVELPDDASINELLPALVKELGLPLTSPDGDAVAYELSNKRSGREYQENSTLSSAGTKTGDSLLLTSTFVAGVDDLNRHLVLGEPLSELVHSLGAGAIHQTAHLLDDSPIGHAPCGHKKCSGTRCVAETFLSLLATSINQELLQACLPLPPTVRFGMEACNTPEDAQASVKHSILQLVEHGWVERQESDSGLPMLVLTIPTGN